MTDPTTSKPSKVMEYTSLLVGLSLVIIGLANYDISSAALTSAGAVVVLEKVRNGSGTRRNGESR